MRVYNFKGQGIILSYQLIGNGIEITTVVNGKVKHILYNSLDLLQGYDTISDVMDDLSYDFINRLEGEVE